MFEWWIQDSKWKGTLLQKFWVHPNNSNVLSWVEEDGKKQFRYGRQELIDNGWIFMEEETENELG